MSVNVALKFFNILFGEEDELERGYILITNLNDFKFFRKQSEAAKFALELGAKCDVYFGTGIYGDIPKSTSGYEADVAGRAAFVFDIDIKGPNHKKTNLVENIEEGLEMLKTAFPIFEPTVVNMTGGGMHAYFKFKEIEWFDTDEQRKKHKELSVQVFRTLESVFKSRDYGIDNVSNLNRILRVPGTYNFKNGSMAPVYTKIINEGREVLPEDFEPFLREETVQERIRATPKAVGTGVNPLNIKADPDASPPYEKLNNLLEMNPRFKAIWKFGKAIRREYKDDMSSMDMALANIAMNVEWKDQEIADLIITFRRINGEEKDKQKALRVDYLCYTINKSRDKLLRSIGIKDLAEKSKEIFAEESDEKKQELRKDVLDSLNEVLGVTINEVRMFTGDETVFEIDVNGISCPIGPVNKLFSQQNVMQQVSIVAREYIHGVDKKDWPNIVTILLKSAKEIKIDFCMTEVGILKERIRNYIEDVKIYDNKDEAFPYGNPFVWKDEIYIFIGSFRTWLAAKGDKIDSKSLGQNLKKLNLESKVMKFRRDGGKQTTRWVYMVGKANEEGVPESES